MSRKAAAELLADRICRPQRVGLFGHRGVGKTTLLTVLYREAVNGRLEGLRLAAADAQTAEYLSGKVVQLEAGQTLPATLAETDLRFQLYHEQNRVELLLRDYQGEHVEIGREGSIQEFLRECDAVWLCLDLGIVPDAESQLRRQQEIERLLEDYLKCEARPTLERPMALVLTKADLLAKPPADLDELAQTHFGMTRHALNLHCPSSGLFAVSSLAVLGGQGAGDCGLAAVLTWLAKTLQALDESRMRRLFSMTGNIALLARCVGALQRRYPDAPATTAFGQQLHELKRRRRRRWALAGLAAAVCTVIGLWTYDAVGHQEASRFAVVHETDPQAVLEKWEEFESWHPTRRLTQNVTPESEQQRRQELAQQIRERDRDGRLAALRREAADPDADPSASWQRFLEFRAAHPEVNIEGDLEQLRAVIKARHDEQFNQRARAALDELVRAAQRAEDLPAVVKQADRFLSEFGSASCAAEARLCRQAVLRRLDERDIQAARAYSARNPLNFQTRREHYQKYLLQHPTDGAFTKEAEEALRTIAGQWDKHDFRAVRDHFVRDPGNTGGLVAHCRRYLAVHPDGKFKPQAVELLRWSERVTAPGEYRVVLRSGSFDSSIGRWFTRGPKLSVEIEVNGVRHGPSTISYNTFHPEWEFEFPRRIRWQLGQPVVVRVKDHNWSEKVVMEVASEPNDPLAIRLLCGEVTAGGQRLLLTSDFAMPVLPRIE